MNLPSLFTSILNLSELMVTKVVKTKESYTLHVESVLGERICPKCRKKCTRVKSYRERKIQDLRISEKAVVLHLTVRQFVCSCGSTFLEPFTFVRPHKRVTSRYEQSIFKSSHGVDLTYIATQTGLDWKTVQEIFTYYGNEVLANRNVWSTVTHLAIDEIALKKGHGDYVAVVINLQSGVILDILEDRTKDFLIKYFQAKGTAFCEQIEVFCSDMWKGYITLGKTVFPKASLVIDRFHFFAPCQKAVDKMRKDLRKQFSHMEELKRLKYLLLKRTENLTEREQQKLQAAFDRPELVQLQQAYTAKCLLQAFFDSFWTKELAEQVIEQWVSQVKELGLSCFDKFINTYQDKKQYILNYFEGRHTTGKLEGINNKLKLIKRRAFGFLQFQQFRLRALIEFS